MKKRQFSFNREEEVSGEDVDHLLDQILKSDPMISLPSGFADRVVMKVMKRNAIRQSFHEFLIYAGVVLAVLVTFLTAIYLSDNETIKGWMELLSPYRMLLAGMAFVLLFILFLDRVIMPRFFVRREVV